MDAEEAYRYFETRGVHTSLPLRVHGHRHFMSPRELYVEGDAVSGDSARYVALIISIYVFVSVYSRSAFIYIYICIFVCRSICRDRLIGRQINIYSWICVCVCVCVCMCVCVHVYVCVCVCVCVCMYVCVCVCVCVCV